MEFSDELLKLIAAAQNDSDHVVAQARANTEMMHQLSWHLEAECYGATKLRELMGRREEVFDNLISKMGVSWRQGGTYIDGGSSSQLPKPDAPAKTVSNGNDYDHGYDDQSLRDLLARFEPAANYDASK